MTAKARRCAVGTSNLSTLSSISGSSDRYNALMSTSPKGETSLPFESPLGGYSARSRKEISNKSFVARRQRLRLKPQARGLMPTTGSAKEFQLCLELRALDFGFTKFLKGILYQPCLLPPHLSFPTHRPYGLRFVHRLA